MTLTLVLFDVDGTLVDSQAHIMGAMELAFDVAGMECPSREQVLAIVGLSLDQAFFRLAPEASQEKRIELREGYKQGFQTLRKTQDLSPLYPGALDCLRELNAQDDIVLGVATGKSRRGLDHVLDSHNLRYMFVTTQVADDHPSKPHPAMAQTAMLESGADTGIMIGDTTYDMEMGHAAGLKTLAVTWGYQPAQALRPHADHVIDHFGQTTTAIETLRSAR